MTVTPSQKETPMDKTSLFERLGGSAGISTLVDDIVKRHTENPTIRARFRPYLDTPERLAQIKQHTCEFLEAGSGGKARYTGRSMGEAHRGMNIDDGEYMAVTDDIMAALRHRAIDEQTQKDVLMIAYALRGEILRK
jgi:hemoglobin